MSLENYEANDYGHDLNLLIILQYYVFISYINGCKGYILQQQQQQHTLIPISVGYYSANSDHE